MKKIFYFQYLTFLSKILKHTRSAGKKMLIFKIFLSDPFLCRAEKLGI